MALLSKFFGRTASEGAAYAFGVATGPVLAPATEQIRQEAWDHYRTRIPLVGALAEGVATEKLPDAEAREWAHKQGYDDAAFNALVAVARVGPGLAQAFHLWRRQQIDHAGFTRALKRLGLADEWIAALWNVREEVLDPADLARAIHRGLIPDPGLLQGTLPKGTGHVAAYPVYDVDALEEAQAAGYDRNHLGVLVGLQGNPMGAHEAAQAEFRGILTHDDYLRAIAEGNTRNEWAEPIREQTRQIPTARDFLENALRGYRTLREALDGAARHGMSTEDATMIYQNQGRPMAIRQITQALARGGKFKPEPGEIRDPYDAAIVEGNLKPAYYDLAKSLRYTMPGTFAIRALGQSGVWDEAKVALRLKQSGWLPEDADEVAKAWTTKGGATADTHVGKAQTQLWNTTHASYVGNEITDAPARRALAAAGVTAAAIPDVLRIWQAERDLIRKQLSPADVRKAFKKAAKNTATGAAWTRDEAISALVALGYSVQTANDYLDIP